MFVSLSMSVCLKQSPYINLNFWVYCDRKLQALTKVVFYYETNCFYLTNKLLIDVLTYQREK